MNYSEYFIFVILIYYTASYWRFGFLCVIKHDLESDWAICIGREQSEMGHMGDNHSKAPKLQSS